MAEAVFSVRPALPRAASIRAIAASNLLVSALVSVAFGVSIGAVGCVTAGAGVSATGAAGCSVVGAATVGVAVSFEAKDLFESSGFPALEFTCSFVAVVVEGPSA